MSDEVKEAYSPGLAGVIAGESAICWVHPDSGLLYRGYDIHELAKQSSFEEVTWLLLHGELPTMEQVGEFEHDLAAERSLPRTPFLKCYDCFRPGRTRWMRCARASRCSPHSIPT